MTAQRCLFSWFIFSIIYLEWSWIENRQHLQLGMLYHRAALTKVHDFSVVEVGKRVQGN